MKKFYDVPTQVCFYDDMNEPKFGIGYLDVIICGCCGSIHEISEVRKVRELAWINIRDAISGDESKDEEPDINDDVDETGYNPYMGCCDDDC